MADNTRIEDLRRRIQKDPASIAFAQLAEEYRRSGRCREAIEICRAGLKHHPGYLSARVTLGRALLETGDLEQAEHELKEVLRLAPENLAALRGVAEALSRRGDHGAALSHYEIALALAPRDLELQHTVASLRDQLRPPAGVAASPAPTPTTAAAPEAPPARAPEAPAAEPEPPVTPLPEAIVAAPPETSPTRAPDATVVASSEASIVPAPEAPAPAQQVPHVLPVLERWLEFIIADRQQRSQSAVSS